MNIEDQTSIHINRKNQFHGDPKSSPVAQDDASIGQISSFQMEIEYLGGSSSAEPENAFEDKYPESEKSNTKMFDPEHANIDYDIPIQIDTRKTNSLSLLESPSDDPSIINTNTINLDASQAERKEQIGITQKEPDLIPSNIKIGSGEFKASPAILAQMRLSKNSVYQNATTTNINPSALVADQHSNSPDLQQIAKPVQPPPKTSNMPIQLSENAKVETPRVMNQEARKSKSDVKAAPNNLNILEKPPAGKAAAITKRPTEQIYSKDNNSHQLNSNKSHGEVLVKVTNPDAQYSTAQSPAQQIFEKIQKHISGSETKTSNFSEAPSSRLGADPVSNTISVKLSPENLGTVDVVIKKLGERISIEIQTNNIDAEMALKSESNSMAKLLKESGLTLEEFEVSTNSQIEIIEEDKKKQKAFNLLERDSMYDQSKMANTDNKNNTSSKQDGRPADSSIVEQNGLNAADGRIGVYI